MHQLKVAGSSWAVKAMPLPADPCKPREVSWMSCLTLGTLPCPSPSFPGPLGHPVGIGQWNSAKEKRNGENKVGRLTPFLQGQSQDLDGSEQLMSVSPFSQHFSSESEQLCHECPRWLGSNDSTLPAVSTVALFHPLKCQLCLARVRMD